MKSVKEYFSKDEKSGYDLKGKRKLNIDEKEECKKIKVISLYERLLAYMRRSQNSF